MQRLVSRFFVFAALPMGLCDPAVQLGITALGLGYKGLQIPGWDRRAIDLDKAAESKAYCDDYRGALAALGLEVTELAGYLAGQVLAVHPAYEELFEAFHRSNLGRGSRSRYPAFPSSAESLRVKLS